MASIISAATLVAASIAKCRSYVLSAVTNKGKRKPRRRKFCNSQSCGRHYSNKMGANTLSSQLAPVALVTPMQRAGTEGTNQKNVRKAKLLTRQ